MQRRTKPVVVTYKDSLEQTSCRNRENRPCQRAKHIARAYILLMIRELENISGLEVS